MSFFEAVFSGNTLNSILRMSTPLIFIAMAACIGRKASITSIAYEGMALFSALCGTLGSHYTNSLGLGALIGIFAGMTVAIIFAYFVLYLDTDAMLIGLALNSLGNFGTVYLLFLLTGRKSDSSSYSSLSFPNIDISALKDVPVLGAIFNNTNVLTYLAIVATIVIFIIIYKTPFGLRLRSVGESPDAAQSVGINVKRTRFIVMLISGFLASVGGLFMSMAYLPYFTKNMLSGRGFIGLAACNLAAGHPLGAFACAVLFGAADAIANLAQTFRMPAQFASMMPYIVTIIGLCVTGYRSTHQKVKKAKEAKAA
ncbi:MAG: ABC transporter permease [Oscillospiraceae bacterium]|jgi:ABC-type uncharacterized transport system permease subunit|nr:ABC transporter permease [Oscillospiraceae bacterium]